MGRASVSVRALVGRVCRTPRYQREGIQAEYARRRPCMPSYSRLGSAAVGAAADGVLASIDWLDSGRRPT
jgi:hypothetical protein